MQSKKNNSSSDLFDILFILLPIWIFSLGHFQWHQFKLNAINNTAYNRANLIKSANSQPESRDHSKSNNHELLGIEPELRLHMTVQSGRLLLYSL